MKRNVNAFSQSHIRAEGNNSTKADQVDVLMNDEQLKAKVFARFGDEIDIYREGNTGRKGNTVSNSSQRREAAI
jgi:hypothetical protein